MKAPLLHVGYHKAGSSWLQRELFPRRELGFVRIGTRQARIYAPGPLDFDAESFRTHYRPLLDAVAREGAIPVVSEERFSGNPHSGGYDSKDLAERLAAIFPDAKVLLVIREQRSAILSTWFQYVKVGGACSLRDYLCGERDYRLPGFRFEYFEYDRLVAHYQKLFGRERVKVELFERFRREPEEFAASILAFAEARAADGLRFERVINPASTPLATALRRRLNPFARRDSVNGYSPMANPVTALLARGLVGLVELLTPRALDARLRRRWQALVQEQVGTRYVESNRRLAALIGSDLSAWGYA